MPRARATSYVIPAHNAGVTLSLTLRSLIEQRSPRWRAIVVDDGSTDDTASVAESFDDPRITVIRQPNQGVAGARQTGFDLLDDDGSLVCFLDADDLVEPDHAGALGQSIGDADAVACGYRLIDERGADLDWMHLPGEGDDRRARLLECNRFLIGGVALRRSVLKRVCQEYGSLFDLDLRCEDWDFWLRLAKVGARWAPPVERALLVYRQGPATRSMHRRAMHRDSLCVVRRHARDQHEAARCMRRSAINALARAIVAGDDELAQEVHAELGSLDPDERELLPSALQWALLIEERSRFTQGMVGAHDLAGRIERVLGSSVDVQAIAARALVTDRAWKGIAQRALQRLAPGQMLVVYGMGRNGRLLMDVLVELAPDRVAWMDDGDQVERRAPRILLPDVTGDHLVIVTPFERCAMLDAARASGAAGVLVPEELRAERASAGSGVDLARAAPLQG